MRDIPRAPVRIPVGAQRLGLVFFRIGDLQINTSLGSGRLSLGLLLTLQTLLKGSQLGLGLCAGLRYLQALHIGALSLGSLRHIQGQLCLRTRASHIKQILFNKGMLIATWKLPLLEQGNKYMGELFAFGLWSAKDLYPVADPGPSARLGLHLTVGLDHPLMQCLQAEILSTCQITQPPNGLGYDLGLMGIQINTLGQTLDIQQLIEHIQSMHGIALGALLAQQLNRLPVP